MNEGIATPHAKHVLLALTGGAAIMLASGGKFSDLRNKLRGEPTEPTRFDANTLAGWAVLLTVMIFMADIPVTGPLAVGFAWLIFLGIAMLYGPAAAAKIVEMMGGTPTVRSDTPQYGDTTRGPVPI